MLAGRYLPVLFCFIALVLYMWKAEETWGRKGLLALIYAASWAAGPALGTTFPAGLLIQVGLCIYFILYFHVR